MHVKELAEIVAVNIEGKPWFDCEARFPEPQEVLSICSSLITTENDIDIRSRDPRKSYGPIVRLAHFSVQEYLLSERIRTDGAKAYAIHEIPAHKSIAATCIAYLLQFDQHDAETRTVIQEFPLVLYAADHWAEHARFMNGDFTLGDLCLEFLIHCQIAYDNWYKILLALRDFYADQFFKYLGLYQRQPIPALIIAAWAGLTEIVQLLLEHGADINVRDESDGTALQETSNSPNAGAEMVQLLVERGADVNAQGGEYYTALQAACDSGSEKVVQLLLEKGADVNAQGGHYGTALQAACYSGSEKAVQLLLEKGADVNTQGGHYGTALQAACFSGFEKAVQLLLEKGADVNAQGGYYGTALQAAAYNGQADTTQLLLESGADANIQSGEYGSALKAARVYPRGSKREKIVQLLESALES